MTEEAFFVLSHRLKAGTCAKEPLPESDRQEIKCVSIEFHRCQRAQRCRVVLPYQVYVLIETDRYVAQGFCRETNYRNRLLRVTSSSIVRYPRIQIWREMTAAFHQHNRRCKSEIFEDLQVAAIHVNRNKRDVFFISPGPLKQI